MGAYRVNYISPNYKQPLKALEAVPLVFTRSFLKLQDLADEARGRHTETTHGTLRLELMSKSHARSKKQKHFRQRLSGRSMKR